MLKRIKKAVLTVMVFSLCGCSGTADKKPAGENYTIYIGTDLHYVGSSPDSGEFLGVEKIPLTDLVAMCDDGRICDSKTTVLIYKAARRFIG